MENQIIYVVLDKDKETVLVITDQEEAIDEFIWQLKKGKAVLEIWRNGNFLSDIYSNELEGINWKKEILKKIEEVKNSEG